MPPLNRLIEDQENNSWHRQVPAHDGSRNNNISAISGSTSKVVASNEDSSTLKCRTHFNDCPEIHQIPGRDDYSSEEIQDCWYTASEFSRFRLDICTTVYLHKIDPSRIDGKEYTMRGVEHKMGDSSCRRYCLRSRARSAVLDEQDFQEGIGEPSAERLAALYSVAAKDAVLDALNLAALDQLEAFRYQNEAVTDEFFPDEWISSISTTPRVESISCHAYKAELKFLEEASGFDDSWIRDVTADTGKMGL